MQGHQKKYLRGLAHDFKPALMIGRNGLNEAVFEALDDALDAHELIKVKFVDFKEKTQKLALIAEMEECSLAEAVGLTGHIAIFYRQNRDPKKRRITLPREKNNP